MNRLLLTALLFMYSFSYSVNVTFRVNSSTVDGVVDSTSGVDLRGTVTQWGPGTNMVSDGGDYWSLTVALEPGNYAYKYGAQIKNEDGTISDYWENDIPGANYVGGDRTLTVGSTDMTIDLDYLGSGPGTPYYEMTETGSISWDVTLADAGTYSLVVHNRAPYGTKGNHVRVNGVGLKNRTTNGEWMFDYTYPADGSFLATVVSEDSLVDVTGTPLQLAAGTHTISIEKSWGYMDFGNVEVYSGDAATTGTLVATLSVPDAVAEGVTPAVLGASWVPEGFKGVTLDAGGSVSGTYDATQGGQYLARVYFASAGASDIEMKVNGAVASTIAVSDTGDAFSTFFGFNQGSNTLQFSSTAGGVTIDKVQFLLNNSVTASVDSKPIIADGFVLKDAYPNPFNPSTKIEFRLPVDHRVSLAVYNIAGQQVKVLADSKFSAGTNYVKWNGTNSAGRKVSSGQYFCVMEYAKTVKVIKLTLMQ